MAGIQDVLLARARVLKVIREAYIDLYGMDFVLQAILSSENRRDFYGDVKNASATYIDTPLRMVVSQRDYRLMVDVHKAAVLEVPGATRNEYDIQASRNYSGMVKHAISIKKGDIIVIQDPKIDDFHQTNRLKFRVVDVGEHVNVVPLSKKVTMSPYF